MPQIGSRLVDETGVQIVMDWLASLPSDQPDPTRDELNRQAAETVAEPTKDRITTLLSSTRSSLALMHAALQSPQSETTRTKTAQVAKEHDNVLVRELFQHWLTPDERRDTLGSDIQAQVVLKLQGDAARGQELFFGASQCFTCHQLNGQGRAFGPDLIQSAARYDRTALLDHILNPSKTVAPEYRTVSITLNDDTEVSGLVLEKSETETILIDAALNEHRIKNDQIFDRFESSLSAMPEGLLATLTAQEAADLLDYLVSLKR